MGITNPGEEYFKDGNWGWDGSEWRKLALLWGYTSRWAEEQTDVTAGGGNVYVQIGAVPAGYVYTLQLSVTRNRVTTVTQRHELVTGGIAYPYDVTAAVGAAGWHAVFPIGVCMAEGDIVRAYFIGCAAGDTLDFRVWGYKMKVT